MVLCFTVLLLVIFATASHMFNIDTTLIVVHLDYKIPLLHTQSPLNIFPPSVSCWGVMLGAFEMTAMECTLINGGKNGI